ncbi:MAG: helix-turn-helix transcriptional regulator [Clostridiales bacterium]|jgi:predicted transcriptional regulator|nr:helix-turn-helix transcriptional regulator [Clostridiales bacterium]
MVKKNKLKGNIIERGLTVGQLAESINIDKSTFYRKLNKDVESFTIKEVSLIIKTLNLSLDEIHEIFFAENVAQTQYDLSNEKDLKGERAELNTK